MKKIYTLFSDFSRKTTFLHYFIILLFSIAVSNVCFSAKNNQPIYILNIDTAIGPASFDYLERGIDRAQMNNANAIIIKIDTPGGLVTSMREMARSIMHSKIPIIMYVSPSGGRAASAGAFLVYSSHIAAMAPGTNIGAASPIPLGGDPPPVHVDDHERQESKEVRAKTTGQVKAVEDLSAFMRALAQKNNRNIDLGVEMVVKGSSFTADEAKKNNIVEFISDNIDQLLTQIDGKSVKVNGETYTIQTNDAPVVELNPDWKSRFLSIITDPNITYILLIIGVYGVLLEFYSPGAFYPGVIGSISLVIAGYSLHLLPVNFTGLSLLLLGIIFLIFESITPSYGIFGIGGLFSFVMGSLFLLDTSYPVFHIAPELVFTMTVITGTFFFLVMRFVYGTLTSKTVSGAEELIGKKAIVIDSFKGVGYTKCDGTIYKSHSKMQVVSGQEVIIESVDGIVLNVSPVSNFNLSN